MRISAYDSNGHEYEVIDLDTGKPIRGVQWADDKTGELERLIFNEEKGELLYKNGNVCPVRERRNIKLVKKLEVYNGERK